jgi:hypothetical protein
MILLLLLHSMAGGWVAIFISSQNSRFWHELKMKHFILCTPPTHYTPIYIQQQEL